FSLKVRQPLGNMKYWLNKKLDDDIESVIRDELNVKKIVYAGKSKDQKQDFQVLLDTKLSKDLRQKGEVRDLIRSIQMLRKEKRCKIDERISIVLEKKYKTLTAAMLDIVKKETLAKKLIWGKKLEVLTG
ncbi:DUF5915 domain-containing protein, partial [Patescibacteria group bacterium]